MKSGKFNFIMISAMYENGGNVTQRHLDGHPELFVYPFESQLGTPLAGDFLSSFVPFKYRWPVFPLDGTAYEDYKLIIDEEGKVRTRTPNVSKFRHREFDLNDDERCEIYQTYIKKLGRSRSHNMEAFFRSTFDAWKDYRRSGREEFYVGYSPILVVDAHKILEEMPQAHFLHVVRNPWSAYADTKKRPVPLSLENYIFCWNANQYFALLCQKKYPKRMHILRIEDTLEDSYRTLGNLCKKLDLKPADSLRKVSWNAQELKEVYPWGTIREATPQANHKTALELSKKEREEIRIRTTPYLEHFGYNHFI